jgi:hypothetical protein
MQSTPKAKFEQKNVDTAKENLEAMPPAPREARLLTIGQAIRELTPTIAKLMRRGYSRAKIIELLKEQGIDCTAATFRTVYRAPKPRARDAKRQASNTATAGATAPASQAPPARRRARTGDRSGDGPQQSPHR